jgi:ABC-type uncharacterized transport system substrate-binding protein
MDTNPTHHKKPFRLYSLTHMSALALFILSCLPSQAGEKILLVNSYHKGYPWSDRIIEGVRYALRDMEVDLKVVYMDSKRYPDESAKEAAGRQAMDFFEAFDPDYVIATDDNAQAYFARHLVGRQRPQLVFAGVNRDPAEYGYPASNVTGVLERQFYRESLSLLKELRPEIRSILLLGDDSETTTAIFENIAGIRDSELLLANLHQVHTFEEWQQAILAAPEHADAVAFGLYHTIRGIDGQTVVDPKTIMNWTTEHLLMPSMGFFDFVIDDGALCGYVNSAYEYGVMTGEMVRDMIQNDKRANDIPINSARTGIRMINLNTAEKLEIDIEGFSRKSPLIFSGGFGLDARSTLRVSTAFLEAQLDQIFPSLRFIAQTAAAKAGSWPDIRPNLAIINSMVTGARSFYALPDGDIYTVENGLEQKKLSDQAFFSRLIEGNDIHGAPVYERSTGNKYAVFAVPVRENDLVSGALGVMINLHELQQHINRTFELPPDYIWYVVNKAGIGILHADPNLIFFEPARHGDESMRHAMQAITSTLSGTVNYTFAGRHTQAVFQKLSFNNWRLALAKTTAYTDVSKLPDMAHTLTELSSGMQNLLNDMDKQLTQAVSRFNQKYPDELVAREVFRELYNNIPHAYSFSLIDHNGTMTFLEPHAFQKSQGSDISSDAYFKKVHATRKPLLTPSFRTVEGFHAIALYHPVLDAEGDLLGMVSMLIRPEHMAESLFLPLIVKTNFHPWLLQDDGLVLFDQYLQTAGINILKDPSWQHARELQKFLTKVQQQKRGNEEYLLLNQQLQEKVMQQARWETIGLHGQEWKVILSADPFRAND